MAISNKLFNKLKGSFYEKIIQTLLNLIFFPVFFFTNSFAKSADSKTYKTYKEILFELESRGINLEDKDLSGKNFSGLDLRKVDFSDKILVDADFRNSILDFDNLKNVNIERAHLEGTKVWLYKIDEELSQHIIRAIKDQKFSNFNFKVTSLGILMIIGGLFTYESFTHYVIQHELNVDLVSLLFSSGLFGASTTFTIVFVANVLTTLRWKRKLAFRNQLRKTPCQFIFR